MLGDRVDARGAVAGAGGTGQRGDVLVADVAERLDEPRAGPVPLDDIVLQQGDRMFTQVAFSIDMTVDISPKSGPVGTPNSARNGAVGAAARPASALHIE